MMGEGHFRFMGGEWSERAALKVGFEMRGWLER